MLSEQEAKNIIQMALDNALDYIKNEQNFIFDKEKIEDCLRKRSEYLGLNQNIYWLNGISNESFNSLGSSLGSSLRSSLGSSLWNSLRSSLGSSLESSLRSSLGSSLRSSLGSSLGSSLRSSLGNSLWSSLGSSLGSSLRSSLESSYNLIWLDSEYLAANNKELKEYSKFMKEAIYSGLGFIFDFEKAIIAIPMPHFRKDEKRRLHSEFQEAIKWHDGFKEYYINGIKFDKELWQKIIDKTITSEEAIKLSNQEQRTIVLEKIGGEKLLSDMGGIRIASDEYGEIYQLTKLKDRMGKSWTYYVAIDPSKNKPIYLRTHPDVKSPKEAMTKAYRLNDLGLEYNPSIRT